MAIRPPSPIGAIVDGIYITDSPSGHQYKVYEDTCYHIDTPDDIIKILHNIRQSGLRVRFHFGDIITGRDWNDEYDVTGTIGRSMGPYKIPLLIKTKRSYGGFSLLDHCIVKITTTIKPYNTLYQHPTYHQ